MQHMGLASLGGAAALIRAIDAHEITWCEFEEAIVGYPPEGLQLISAVLDARAIARTDSSVLVSRSRDFCLARAASLRSLS